MKSYPKMPTEVIAWVRKHELEKYRAYDASRELHAYAPEINYAPLAPVKEIVLEC